MFLIVGKYGIFISNLHFNQCIQSIKAVALYASRNEETTSVMTVCAPLLLTLTDQVQF